MRLLLTCLLFGCASLTTAQYEVPDDWFRSPADGPFVGTGVDRALAELLSGQTPKEVVVAVLDSGVEPDHPDLQNRLWTNADEIPGNGIDDDNNGYIDDIHGWSFLGSGGGDLHYANPSSRAFTKTSAPASKTRATCKSLPKCRPTKPATTK